MCMGILSAHTCMCTMCMPDAIGPLELELESCELPCRCWVLNLSPLEEQPVLLME